MNKNDTTYQKAVFIASVITAVIALLLFAQDLIISHTMRSYEYRPSSSSNENTVWVSDNAFFCVDSNHNCIGQYNNGSDIKDIIVYFGYGHNSSIDAFDYDALFSGKFISKPKDQMLYGWCSFEKEFFTVDVEKSSLCGIDIGSDVRFDRAEKMPDWADENRYHLSKLSSLAYQCGDMIRDSILLHMGM